MPLDTSIISQATFQPIQFKSPDRVNMLLQAAQAANQMEALQAARASREQENALAEYVRGGGAPEGLAQFGAPGARAMQQIQYGQQVAAQTRGVQQKEVEAAMGQFMSALGRTQNAQQARGVLALGFQDPLVSKAIGRFTTPEQAMAGVPDDPAQFNDWLRTQVLAPAERFKERTGAQRYISAGQGRMFDTQTGAYVDMPAAAEAPVPAVPARLTTDQTDRILTQQGYRRRPDGTPEPIPGGRADPETLRRQAEARQPPPRPSAFAEKTEFQRRQTIIELDRTIRELENAAKPGGLIDKSTGSGVGAATDVAAGFVGVATPGAVAIGRLQPIADMVLKMVPRFEGPQSDKDTQSYKDAAGQIANPNIPNKIRRDAAMEIVRIMRARKDQFVLSGSEAPAPAPAPAPATATRPGAAAPAPARTGGARREIAPGVFVTERP